MKPPHLFFQAVEAWAAGLRPQRTELADSEIVGWTDEGVVEVLVEASHAAWCVQHEAQIRQTPSSRSSAERDAARGTTRLLSARCAVCLQMPLGARPLASLRTRSGTRGRPHRTDVSAGRCSMLRAGSSPPRPDGAADAVVVAADLDGQVAVLDDIVGVRDDEHLPELRVGDDVQLFE